MNIQASFFISLRRIDVAPSCIVHQINPEHFSRDMILVWPFGRQRQNGVRKKRGVPARSGGCVATIWEKLDAVHKYTFLAEHFPRFIAAFGPLDDAIRHTFYCGLDESAATPVDMAIYGLGRLCLEDFGEILFLSQHDYGYAAIKLLRGLYERAVVSEVIVENPTTEGERFFKYCAVDAMKFRNQIGRASCRERAHISVVA